MHNCVEGKRIRGKKKKENIKPIFNNDSMKLMLALQVRLHGAKKNRPPFFQLQHVGETREVLHSMQDAQHGFGAS